MGSRRRPAAAMGVFDPGDECFEPLAEFPAGQDGIELGFDDLAHLVQAPPSVFPPEGDGPPGRGTAD